MRIKTIAVSLACFFFLAAGECRSGWTPLKLQVSADGWLWPQADTVAGLNFNFAGDTPSL